jgi:hypothetical protein
MVHKIFLDISQETSMIKILTSPNLIILSCTIVPSCHIGCRRERERKRKREREREREREGERKREKIEGFKCYCFVRLLACFIGMKKCGLVKNLQTQPVRLHRK